MKAEEAALLIQDGDCVAIAGFVGAGISEEVWSTGTSLKMRDGRKT